MFGNASLNGNHQGAPLEVLGWILLIGTEKPIRQFLAIPRITMNEEVDGNLR